MISMPFLSRLTGPIVLLLAAGTLAACSVEVDQGGGYNPRPPQLCTREYAPVCGERGRDRQTFANACEARASGYDILGRGECRFRRPDRDPVGWQDGESDGWQQEGWDRPDRDRNRNDRDRRDRRRDREERVDRERPRDQRACTMEYNPVCGRNGQDFKEFGNACSAEAAGFRVFRAGQCPVR